MKRSKIIALVFILAAVGVVAFGLLPKIGGKYVVTGYATVEDYDWLGAPQARLANVGAVEQGLLEQGCGSSNAAQSIFGATGTDLMVTLMPEQKRFSTGAWTTSPFNRVVSRPFKICNVPSGSHTVCAVAFGDTGGFLDQDCKEFTLA